MESVLLKIAIGTAIAAISAIVVCVYKIGQTIQEQIDFEIKASEEWHNMTAEERLKSGRESMFC